MLPFSNFNLGFFLATVMECYSHIDREKRFCHFEVLQIFTNEYREKQLEYIANILVIKLEKKGPEELSWWALGE